MTRRFVAINDPVHRLLRHLTVRSPLRPVAAADGSLLCEYRVQPQAVPEAYYALAARRIQDLEDRPCTVSRPPARPLPPAAKAALLERAGFFDAIRLDQRCARDLRLKIRMNGPGLLAAELLTYGTGTLRARNDNLSEDIQHQLWHRSGRLETRYEVVFARILALQGDSSPQPQERRKETFDSTNVIFGDAMGEIEQLWERRADTTFLGLVALSLQRMPRHAQIAAFERPPLNPEAVLKAHLRAQALWRKPPASARVLLRRLEFILDHTVVDSAASTRFSTPREVSRTDAGAPSSSGVEWKTDPSGYDGWLKS